MRLPLHKPGHRFVTGFFVLVAVTQVALVLLAIIRTFFQ